MPRKIELTEAEIQSILDANPHWLTNAVDKALITELIHEKNALISATPTGKFLSLFAALKIIRIFHLLYLS
jgi:hypothetical protein